MGRRPRISTIYDGAATAHIIGRTHDDTNRLFAFCGQIIDGQHSGGTQLCGRCRQIFGDITEDVAAFEGRRP
jgi:hypothetical protein